MANDDAKREPGAEILERVAPGRRDFLRTLIAGAGFSAPLLMSFSLDGLSMGAAEAYHTTSNMFASNQCDPYGYVGRRVFTAFAFEDKGRTRANAWARFELVRLRREPAYLETRLRSSPNTRVLEAYINRFSGPGDVCPPSVPCDHPLANVAVGAGRIGPTDLLPTRAGCAFDALLEEMAAMHAELVVQVDDGRGVFVLRGPLIPEA